MEAFINIHQLSLFLKLIQEKYEIYGHQERGGLIIFDKLENISDLYLGLKRKTTIPFKKIIFPNHRIPTENIDRKIALIGLNNCDTWAIEKLYKELENYTLLPPRKNVFVVAEQCLSDDECFCSSMGSNKINSGTDAYIQKEKSEYSLFAFSALAKKLAKEAGLKSDKKPILNPIGPENELDFKEKDLSALVSNRKDKEEFWQSISDNCFGCGACSTVCPLCYCTRQDFKNTADGGCKLCLDWDTCFSKRFSEIQNRYDLRPENVDRLYNWYHHKFVRAYEKNNQFLCVGCGRCIRACPANLNVKGILKNLLKQQVNNNEK